MALSGSVSVEATRSGRDMLVFSWEAVQDQKTMTSTVSWKMELVADSYGRIDQSTAQPWTVTIDGQEFSGTASVNIANNETKQLATGEVVLTHNEDGARSFAFTFSQELNITWGASSGDPIYIGVVTGEGIGELDALARKFPIKEWLKGYLLSLCSPRRTFPKRESIGYLYGHVAKEGETPTHTINGVDYVGAVVPNIYTVYTPKLQAKYPYAHILHRVDPETFPTAGIPYISLMLSTKPPIAGNNEINLYGTPNGCEWQQYITANDEESAAAMTAAGVKCTVGEWTFDVQSTLQPGYMHIHPFDDFVWSVTDVHRQGRYPDDLYSNPEVVFSSVTPIPIYE